MKPVEQFKAIRRIDRAIDELRGQEGAQERPAGSLSWATTSIPCPSF